MSAASDFASSPAGYVSGIIVPSMVVFAGFLGKRALAKQDQRFEQVESHGAEMAASLAANTQALAILVERIQPMSNAITLNTNGYQALREATAVLKQRMDTHEQWASREHDRMLQAKP